MFAGVTLALLRSGASSCPIESIADHALVRLATCIDIALIRPVEGRHKVLADGKVVGRNEVLVPVLRLLCTGIFMLVALPTAAELRTIKAG